MVIELQKDARMKAVFSIQRYFEENMDDEIGNLQAAALLEFFLKEIGPSIYNQAIVDAQAKMMARITDLDVDCYEQEFQYWPVKKHR